jgi:hypothetical protein
MFDQLIHDAFGVKDVLAVFGTLNGLAVYIVGETNGTRRDRGKWIVDAKVCHHFVWRRLQYHLLIRKIFEWMWGKVSQNMRLGTIPYLIFFTSFSHHISIHYMHAVYASTYHPIPANLPIVLAEAARHLQGQENWMKLLMCFLFLVVAVSSLSRNSSISRRCLRRRQLQ